ncbi:hypothetical protein BC937DRAFT_86416 [Endogone sp. FLAS-F59071]|nr:hypothetical protein BC937DRAFT_86416 [Endogone sp. FLAS-F59071]|eukprot:RUS13057.1 hypothetical protein BC937DRAFT_86416 [Endogone sp. FLAS-F59071]
MSNPQPTATIDPPDFSDGDPAKRPDNSSKPVDGPHAWLVKLGSVLAQAINDNDKEEKRLSRWPNGYALFSQKRQRGAIIDFYLWAEFAPHLRWLATDSTHDNANCECFACHKPSGISRKRSVDSVSPGTPTRVLRARPSIERKAKTAAEQPAKRTIGKKAVPRKAEKKAQDKEAEEKKANDEEEGKEEDEIEDSEEDKTADKESVDHYNEEGSGIVADAEADDTMEIDETRKSKEMAVNGREP